MLANLLKILRTEYKPGPGAFLQIDASSLVEKLGVKKRGQERGGVGQPAADVEILDEVEQEIVSAIRAYAGDAYDRTQKQISTYAERLKSADANGAAVEMKVIARAAESDFEAESLAARKELESAQEEASRRAQVLSDFQRRHGLERPAHPPRDHLILVMGLVIMFGVEVWPNAYILSEGDALGIVGGVSQAMIYSFLNLAFAFVAGLFGWTNMSHRNPFRKTAGFLVFILIAAFVVGLNLAVAHYRVAAQTMPSGEAVEVAWTMLKSDPLAISDIKSAGMVAMGILFAFFAMLEGYIWRDPYPGYQTVDGHHREAQQKLERVIKSKIGHLKGLQEDTIQRIKAERSRLRDRRQQIPMVLEERHRLISSFGSYIVHLQDVGRVLLSAYRDSNRASRNGAAPPAHFNSFWTLDGFGRIEVDDDVWAVPNEEFKAADKALEDSVDRLQASFDAALAWIRDLGTKTGKADAVVERD